MTQPLWIIFTEDGDFDGMANGATAEDAARDLYGPDEDITDVQAILVTPEIRHLWALARRRERYAQRRASGWTRTPSPVPPGFHHELGHMAWLSVIDAEGRCRCPRCSRFCRVEDFAGAPSSMRMAGACVDYAPSCWRCRGLERAPYDALVSEMERTGGRDA